MSAEPSSSAAAPSAGRIAATGVDVRRFPWIRRLAGDYAYDFTKVEDLYAGNPLDAAAWRQAVARAQQHPRDRARLVELLQAQQDHRSAPPASREAAARLADPQSVAVVTGQQAGVFGGPMYTLLKAITALQLARRTEREQNVPAIAVFWVEAEDHDWEEVRSCTVLDAEFQPRRVTLADLEGAGELPVAKLQLDARVEHAIAELGDVLQKTEFTDDVLDAIRHAWHPGRGLACAFATWIEHLLGPYGLVVFESADPAAKPLVADVFARELLAPGRSAALAAQAGDTLASRGHEPQVVPQPDSVSLFSLDPVRRSIRRHGEHLDIGEIRHSSAALANEAKSRPSAFSPNVLLRPVVQDTLFPTICYVAGPSELAYLGQLRGVYEQFGVPMPLMYPRATATLLDSGAARFLGKYGIPFEELRTPDESALNRLLEGQLPASVEQSLRDAAAAMQQAMARVIEALPALDATLAGAARTTLGRMEHELKSLHSKVIHAAKKRDETLRRQFQRAQAQAFPHGHPQERELGVVYFLNKYGPGLVEILLDELPIDMGQHWLVTL
ncbi:MAG TPA: bacillithiol biosynthesis cysteine-adding enzyme BshC [Vicinamibacterales bacterium]|nr:bacillithiol biosynthesis cysteine-adding enzyme BshC [Vicinamibacterales bacterium]